jgi:hypothetical protein
MIVPAIVAVLSKDTFISEYCGGRIFTDSAPVGTPCPYVVASAEDSKEEDDVIAVFELEVNIYDYDEDKRRTYEAARRVVSALSYETFKAVGEYSWLRVWFRGRHVFRESDTTLSRIAITFDARAIETF